MGTQVLELSDRGLAAVAAPACGLVGADRVGHDAIMPFANHRLLRPAMSDPVVTLPASDAVGSDPSPAERLDVGAGGGRSH